MDELSEAIKLHHARTRPDKEASLVQEAMLRLVKESCTRLQESESDGSNRKRILKRVDPTFIETSSWSVFLFGSRSDGTSSPSSDIDIGIRLGFKSSRRDRNRLLLKLSQILSKRDPDRSLLVKALLRARYPIIKILDFKSHTTTNVSIADRYCYQRNVLIKQYIGHHTAIYDEILGKSECINELVVFVKHWSKSRGVNDAYSGYLNSFGFVVMVIKFIQWFELNKLKKRKRNKWNLGRILYEFYQFYVVKFDWNSQCVSIAQRFIGDDYQQKETIFDHKLNPYVPLQIVDPVNAKNNIANNIEWTRAQHIKYEFIRAVSILESNKDGLFEKLCDTKTDLVENCNARCDPYGKVHVYYESFEYAKNVGKDIRYEYDPKVKCILTPVPKLSV